MLLKNIYPLTVSHSISAKFYLIVLTISHNSIAPYILTNVFYVFFA